MLTIAEVTPSPIPGQYWASTHPLYLFRVHAFDVETTQHSVETWIPGGTSGSIHLYIGLDLYIKSRWLPESLVVDPDALDFNETLRTGDTIAFSRGELAFVVVDESTMTLHSDWVISKDPAVLNHLRLFQRGPLDPNLEPTTRLERVLGDTCP